MVVNPAILSGPNDADIYSIHSSHYRFNHPSLRPTFQAPPIRKIRERLTDMTGVDLEKYKRIVQYFWDPEPKNDAAPEAPIWCLGQEYAPHVPHDSSSSPTGRLRIRCPTRSPSDRKDAKISMDKPDGASTPAQRAAPTEVAWPDDFLKDFESRIWMTYRSNFIPIPRRDTPDATSHMTLGVRLRSQLMDSHGFTSDTGWGCMIRSGQSLLANTLCILTLGRGDERRPD